MFKRVRLTACGFLADTNGATSIEYALIAAGISVVIVGSVTAIGGKVQALFSAVRDALG